MRTATVRFDVNGTEGLNGWVAVGTGTSNDGDTNPEDIDITTQVSGEFWLQLGLAVRKGAGAGPVGQGQAAVQYGLPTDRPTVLSGPHLLDTVSVPVGPKWAEVWASEWRSFYDLEEVQIPYDVFDTADYEFTFVLQSVKTDPSQEAPAEDTILATTSGNASGVATASSFSNASTNKAQLYRVVLKAKTSSATEGTGRSWFAVAVKYA